MFGRRLPLLVPRLRAVARFRAAHEVVMSKSKTFHVSPAVAPACADLRAQRRRRGVPLCASAAQNAAYAMALEGPLATANTALMQVAGPRVENWLHRAS